MNKTRWAFPRALAAVNRVMLKNKDKDTSKPWADQPLDHHYRHADEHVTEAFDPDAKDGQSGEHPAAHAIARLLMYLELLERKKRHVESTPS